jgi:hypothetical protein
MPLVEFTTLPDDARLWVFPADRALDAAEADRLLTFVDTFLEDWATHGKPLVVGRRWEHEQFLLVAVDEKATGVSGCSVDALVRRLRQLERELEARFTDYRPVWYRDGRKIVTTSRREFAELSQAGVVGADTVVFDNSITSLGAWREGKWELPASNSWHGDLVRR